MMLPYTKDVYHLLTLIPSEQFRRSFDALKTSVSAAGVGVSVPGSICDWLEGEREREETPVFR